MNNGNRWARILFFCGSFLIVIIAVANSFSLLSVESTKLPNKPLRATSFPKGVDKKIRLQHRSHSLPSHLAHSLTKNLFTVNGVPPVFYDVEPPVHQWITLMAYYSLKRNHTVIADELANYLPTQIEASLYANGFKPPETWKTASDKEGDSKTALIEGVWEEDHDHYDSVIGLKKENSFCEHFWNPIEGDFNYGFKSPNDAAATVCGYGRNNSALYRAQYWWANAIREYKMNNLSRAYYYLGRVSHLLEDLSTPAHSLLDPHPDLFDLLGEPDAFHVFTAQNGNYKKILATHPNAYIRQISQLQEYQKTTDSTYEKDLTKIIYNLSREAALYDSDDINGYSSIHGQGVYRSARISLTPQKEVSIIDEVNELGLQVRELRSGNDYKIDRKLLGDYVYFYRGFYDYINNSSHGVRVYYSDGSYKTYFNLDEFGIRGSIPDEVIEKIYQPNLQAAAVGYVATLFKLFWEKTHPTDTESPKISITTTLPTTTSTSPITISGKATDNISVMRVKWTNLNTSESYDAIFTGSDSKNKSWAASVRLGNGPNVIVFQVFDATGNYDDTRPVINYTGNTTTPVVDTTPPILKITSPKGSVTLNCSNTTSIAGNASETIKQLRWSLNNGTVNMTSVTGTTWRINVANLPLGQNLISVKAVDLAGNESREAATINVTVASTPPTSSGTSVSLLGNVRPTHANGTLVKTSSNDTVYLLRNGQRWGITKATLLTNLYQQTNAKFDTKEIVVISIDEINNYPPGPNITAALPGNGRSQPDGKLIKQKGEEEVSIVTNNGNRRPFKDADTFLKLGYQFCNVIEVTDYSSYPEQQPADAGTLLKLTSIEPALTQVKDWGASVTYTFKVTDELGNPVSGAFVGGTDNLRNTAFLATATTDASGQGSYTTFVPNGTANQTFNVVFMAEKDGYTTSDAIARQIQVNHAIDATPPTVTITTPTTTPVTVTSSPITLSGTASDNAGIARITWANEGISSGLASGTNNWTASGISLKSGVNLIFITAQDTTGNIGFAVQTVVFNPDSADSVNPIATITLPTNAPTYTTTNSPTTLAGTASDNVAVADVYWENDQGGGGLAQGTSSWLVSDLNLQPGVNNITIRARDTAGNFGITSIAITYAPDLKPVADFSWQYKQPLPAANYNASVVAVNGKIHIIGGNPRSAHYRYSPSDGTYETLPSPQGNGIWEGGAAVIGAKIYALGNPFDTILKIFDTTNNTWSEGTALPGVRRRGHSVAAVEGKLYVIGGLDPNNNALNSIAIYDPATSSWSEGVPMPTARGFAVALVVNGQIYVLGGLNEKLSPSITDKAERYSPTGNTWFIAKNPVPEGSYLAVGGVLGNKMYLAGGGNGSGGGVSSVYEFDPATETWRALSWVQTGRAQAIGAVANNKFYLFGGYSDNGPIQTIEEGTPLPGPGLRIEPSSITVDSGRGYGMAVYLSAPQTATIDLPLSTSNRDVAFPDQLIVRIPKGSNAGFFSVSGTNPGGPVVITATLPDSLGGGVGSAQVTVRACPILEKITPTAGVAGATVIITGKYFSNTSSVKFGTNALGFSDAPFHIDSPTQITTSIPLTATTAGQFSISSPDCNESRSILFNLQPCPTVTTFSPTNAAVGGKLLISGTGLIGVRNIIFPGEKSAPFQIDSPTQITATVPEGALSGPVFLVTEGCSNQVIPNFTVLRPPLVTTSLVVSIASDSGSLNGVVNPNGLGTTAHFEWSTDSKLTTFNVTPIQSIGTSNSPITVAAKLSGLAAKTTYYYRVVGSNTAGTEKGQIFSFTTSDAQANPQPILTSLSPSFIEAGSTAFTLNVTGKDFVAGARVYWNGVERLTYFVSLTQLQVSILESDLTQVGVASINVRNPSPSNGESNSLPFSIRYTGSRVLQIVNVTTTPGGIVNIPIEIVSQGDENAIGFSLMFEPSLLTYTGVALGKDATGATLVTNTTQLANGKIGIAIGIPNRQTLAAGTRQFALVSFRVASGVQPLTTQIHFGDMPVERSVVSGDVNFLLANYLTGTITIVTGYEADVAPRPNGNSTISIADWVQLGRFVAAIDTIADASEFQRADCAPKATLGDGKISISDWVQAGRYAAGLDPVMAAGGATTPMPTLGEATTENLPNQPSAELSRIIRAVNGNFSRGQLGTLPIELEAQGGENGIAFSLNFDPKTLNFVTALIGDSANGAALQVNRSQLANGKLGIALVLPAGQSFVAGTRTLLKLQLIPAGGEGEVSTQVNFSDELIRREIADMNAVAVPNVTYASATIKITGKTVATVSAASYAGGEIAAESIVSAFGTQLTSLTQGAQSFPLPTSLGGTIIIIKDSKGIERFAPLFYVSPTQINFQIPAETTEGLTTLTIFSSTGTITSGLIMVSKTSPALFAADATGKGLAAGSALHIRPDRSRYEEPLARFNAGENKFVAIPIAVSATNEQVYLTLYGTGIRHRDRLENVKVTMAGIAASVEYAGAQNFYAGLDQINIKIPQGLAGKGEVEVQLILGEKFSNAIKVTMK